MSRELSVAYSRIKRQWPGLVVRQHQPRIKGWPDFILIDGEVIFAEVKWIKHPKVRPILDPTQAHWLEQLRNAGAYSYLLAGHEKGWLAWGPPFSFFLKEPRCSTEMLKPWWEGDHLKFFSIYVSNMVR